MAPAERERGSAVGAVQVNTPSDPAPPRLSSLDALGTEVATVTLADVFANTLVE